MGELAGRTALITGAAGGIGAATARLLAGRGAAVALVDLADAGELAAAIAAAGGRACALSGDIAAEADVARLFAAAEATLGPVDILVNNAGILRDRTLAKLDFADWQQVLDVNLSAAFLCCKAALPGMVERRWGRVVSVSSISGITGNFGQTNYAAAKAGLLGFTKSLALEVARKGVTVNAVAPGFIDTKMMRSVPDEVLAEFEQRIPIGRLGRPEDVAHAIAFLAAPDSEYLTGQTIHVNGGYWM